MLRALGSQIAKTTNKEACRDLSGRRLRDINEEERLKKYVAQEAEREREEAEKKEAKLQRLRRIAQGENKHEFCDPKYDKEREDATDRVHDAIEHAFKAGVAKAEGGSKGSGSSGGGSSSDEDPKPSTSGVKRKANDDDVLPKAKGPSDPKKSALW